MVDGPTQDEARELKEAILAERDGMDDAQKEKFREAHSTILLHADAHEYSDQAMLLIMCDRALGEASVV